MGALKELLGHLRADPAFMRCVTAWERIPARPARTGSWPPELDPRLTEAVRALEGFPAWVAAEGARISAVRAVLADREAR